MNAMETILKNVNKEELWNTVTWLTKNTPYRLAGSADEKKASEYICSRMLEYGLEVDNKAFKTYNSDPLSSSFEVITPVSKKIKSLPCAHIRATAPEGEDFELVYAGDGSYDAYKDIDIKGKLALIEVSYAPPVPEKARIAYEMGAAGIVCMNWGNDEDVICHRGLKGIWGNPTKENFNNIPDIVGIGVTHNDGLWLKGLCQTSKVKVHVSAQADRKWTEVHQPTGLLRGNGKSSQFLLICSHLDAWQPGVTCNATGNATTLELCRILSQNKEKLNRNIIFVFWDGHEIAEAAGSTWFVDNNWDLLNKDCIVYMHIDSTGVKDTEIYEIKASEELLDYAIENVQSIVPGKLRFMSLKKIGDQSFMGIGVASVTQRMSFTKEAMEYAHGATLGWWNHTCEDGLDKCDLDTLYTDTLVHLSLAFKLANSKVLPYNFESKFTRLIDNLESVQAKYGSQYDISDLIENAKETKASVLKVQQFSNSINEGKTDLLNEFFLSVSRHITNITLTRADKYQQDSYGHTDLSFPVPLLAEIKELGNYKEGCLEYGLAMTSLIKNRNRISDTLYEIKNLANLYQIILGE